MMRKRIVNLLLHAFLCGSIGIGVVGVLTAPSAHAADSLRPEVGKPLQAAQELAKGYHYKEALGKISEADAVSGKTPYEIYVVERMRGAVAQEAGDTAIAAKAFESLINSGRLPAADQQKMMEAVAVLNYQSKNYSGAAQWAQRYLKEGGSDPQMRTMLTQAYYLNNDCTGVSNAVQPEIDQDVKAGRSPAEQSLQLLASCYQKQNNGAGYVSVLEQLVSFYPKRSYWADLLHRVETKPGFSDRLDLDLYRLKRATGDFGTADDYMEMTQLSLQAGYPEEAHKVIEEGFASGVLGSGADAARQQRLRALAEKSARQDQQALAQNESQAKSASDGTGLVNVGFAYILEGQAQKGVELIQAGMEKGGLKHPDDAKLHLGVGYWLAGQKAKAVATFKSVQGEDGSRDLARLWVIRAQSPASA